MKTLPQTGFLLALLLLGFSQARAQDFPWNDFKPRTLSEIIEQNIAVQKDAAEHVKNAQPIKQHIAIDADPLPSVVRLTYTGKTKPISDDRKNYLKLWLQALGKNPELNDLCNVEMLATEGSTSYWLLVQKQLIPAFSKEISAGQPVDLYLIRMGGFTTEKGWDWMFLVEEFRAPGSNDTAAFPWNDFERRTLQELVKINVAEDANDLQRYPDKGQFVFRGKIMPSVVRVTYTGQSRAIGSERKKFIELWADAYAQDPNYANLFESEFLFTEGAQEYWLPMQEPVTSFNKNLKKGDAVDLYLIRSGGLRVKDKADWIFLIEEFQKPKEKQ